MGEDGVLEYREIVVGVSDADEGIDGNLCGARAFERGPLEGDVVDGGSGCGLRRGAIDLLARSGRLLPSGNVGTAASLKTLDKKSSAGRSM